MASRTDELLCILAFIRSDGDRRSAGGRQFDSETLLEDIKRFLRDKDGVSHLLPLMGVQTPRRLFNARTRINGRDVTRLDVDTVGSVIPELVPSASYSKRGIPRHYSRTLRTRV